MEIRRLADELYRRVDWQWALNGGLTLAHGWKPESGFLPYRWDTYYSEAHLLYILALASSTFLIEQEGYEKWLSTFELKKIYDIEYLYAGPSGSIASLFPIDLKSFCNEAIYEFSSTCNELSALKESIYCCR